MRAPGSLACALHDHPVALGEGGDARAGGDYFKGALVAADGGGFGCAEGGREGRFAGVDALDLVDVCWVHGCGEEAQVYLGAVGCGDGVLVQAGCALVCLIGIALCGERVKVGMRLT